ncbi:MAG: hypothetical protein HQK77_09190 [Desulfobacterales bacterium]|nr:hypothetical protein [Desulfobacterales bacterium]
MDIFKLALEKFDVLNHTPVGMVVINSEYQVLFWNQCIEYWSNKHSNEILGTSLLSHYSHLNTDRYLSRIETIFEGGPPVLFSTHLHQYFIPCLLSNGQWMNQNTTISAFPSFDGNGHYALIAIENVTELTQRVFEYRQMRDKALNEIKQRELAEKEKEKIQAQMLRAQKLESLSVLTRGIAHDFNNQLMGILGNASILKQLVPQDSTLIKYVDKIQQATLKSADLTKQLIDYTGKSKIIANFLNFNQVLKELKPIIDSTVSPHIIVNYELEKELPDVKADTAQIEKVIMHLVTNADEAIGNQSGLITIRTHAKHFSKEELFNAHIEMKLQEGFFSYFEVQDTGHGMDDNTMLKIFDPFFSTRFIGRGLGLTMVLGIVQGHRGTILIESTPQKGSCFRVLLPSQVKKPA